MANRIKEDLREAAGPGAGPATGASGVGAPPVGGLVAVPAWLLLNSMKTEALQFAMLANQEIANVWRKVVVVVVGGSGWGSACSPTRRSPSRTYSVAADHC